jgi:hypothetical protein
VITIEGFTPLQRDIADRLWELDSPEEVAAFMLSLPKNLRRTACVVHDMIIAASIDELVAKMPQYPEAEELVDRFRF